MLRIVALLLVALCLCAQNATRFAELTAKGIANLDQGKFNEALNSLEEVWEQDQSDVAVAENLAMAYLYADHNLIKAKALDEQAIAAGGKAHSFVVEKGQIKEFKANHVYGSSRGMYHLRTADKKDYNFRPRTWSEEEQQLIVQLVNEHLR